MKRSISPEFQSEAKRFDAFVPPSQYQQHTHKQNQQQMHIQQQQILAQQQQQRLQMQHQMQPVQQPPYSNNPPFFNQPPFFPMNSVNMPPFPAPSSSLLYNNNPSWNFMSTPPPFFTPPPSSVGNAAQPPLPPPELKPEKPPLPKDPEPPLSHTKKNDFANRPTGTPSNFNTPALRAPGAAGGVRIRGVNALIRAMFNGFNGGPGAIRVPPPIRQPTIHPSNPGNGMNSFGRIRRRNPHHFPTGNPHNIFPRTDLFHYGDYNEGNQYNEEEQPAGPEKVTIIMNDSDHSQIQVNKKAKRKPMSSRYSRSKEWVLKDAEAALALEKEHSKASKRQMLILKFPDPDLNKYIVKKYSPFIESVHFQQPSTPRYCFVQLKEGADIDKVLETIREIPFGTGKIVAELKTQQSDDQMVSPEEIDPYTLYIGNLPTSISVKAVKMHFPNAQRIDIGYAQRMRYTRYAFIRYNTVEESMNAYKKTVNALLESRSLIVRFRRQKGNIGLPGESKTNTRTPDRTAQPTMKAITWGDADDEDYHEDEDGFIMDEIEEDDDDIVDFDEEALKSLKANRLAFGSIEPKEEVDKDSNDDSRGIQNTKSNNHEKRKKNHEISKASAENTQTSKSSFERTNTDSLRETLEETSRKKPQPDAIILQETNVKSLSSEPLEDSKENVLEKANELLEKVSVVPSVSRSKSESPDCICTDPPEKARKINLQPVKLEHSADESDSDNEGINLLGTRVKDEFPVAPQRAPTPMMEDIYLDDYEYDDMDGEPEEEDDDWADTSLSRRTTNWEEIRRRELNTKEDKPDLDKLAQTTNTNNTTKVLPIVANLEPKSEFEKLYNSRQIHSITDAIEETDDLHDMFAEMNSDLEEDDDEQF